MKIAASVTSLDEDELRPPLGQLAQRDQVVGTLVCVRIVTKGGCNPSQNDCLSVGRYPAQAIPP